MMNNSVGDEVTKREEKTYSIIPPKIFGVIILAVVFSTILLVGHFPLSIKSGNGFRRLDGNIAEELMITSIGSEVVGAKVNIFPVKPIDFDLFYPQEIALSDGENKLSTNAGPARKKPTFPPTRKPSSTAPISKPPSKLPSTTIPTVKPTTKPTSAIPSFKPTIAPTNFPSNIPTTEPTTQETINPTISFTPTYEPTLTPTFPTSEPSASPTKFPTFSPSMIPSTVVPSTSPTRTPVASTSNPTKKPTVVPSTKPTIKPTSIPTKSPAKYPTFAPANDIVYHSPNPVMLGPIKVYHIYYGDFSSTSGQTTVSLMNYFASNIGASDWYNIMTSYYDYTGTYCSASVTYGGSIYQANTTTSGTITSTTVRSAITTAINAGSFPLDPNGVYFFIFRGSITLSGFLTSWCGYHSYFTLGGVNIKYSVIGDPGSATSGGTSCEAIYSNTANGNVGADSMASVYAHELVEAVSDPLLNAWYFTNSGYENADECAWTFGTKLAGSTNANVYVGTKTWYIQRNWQPKYGCVLAKV